MNCAVARRKGGRGEWGGHNSLDISKIDSAVVDLAYPMHNEACNMKMQLLLSALFRWYG